MWRGFWDSYVSGGIGEKTGIVSLLKKDYIGV